MSVNLIYVRSICKVQRKRLSIKNSLSKLSASLYKAVVKLIYTKLEKTKKQKYKPTTRRHK